MTKQKGQTTDYEIPNGLDAVDLEILRLLETNARLTIKEIADKVHLSTSPVHERIKKLEQTGIIQQYVTLLNAAKINKGLWVICYVSLKQHNKNAGLKFIKAIQAMPEVKECYSISGEFDFMLKVAVKNMEDYYDFHVNQLSEAENIGHVQSVFVMGVVKQTHTLLS
ncbi:Lrp/AsnC family transcriptional regulator [Hydrotalea sp.]|uniref:Lrp/AsnC family transcriptional regulator n=1 Tax=Hydrotalea sp. TaxID=2881279 RepID=UPI003D138B73